MTSTLGRSTSPTDRTYLSIREVLELLIGDFPDVTISKIRFLEARGLIHPERTPSGYRKFYREDVDRLRWILRQQRENYLPLNVIKVRLDGGQLTDEPGADAPSLFDDAPFEPPPSADMSDEPFPPVSFQEKPTVFRGHPAEGLTDTHRHLGIHRDPVIDGESPESAPLASLGAAVVPTKTAQPVSIEDEVVIGDASHEAEAVEIEAVAPAVEAPPARTRSTSRRRSPQRDGYNISELAIAIGADQQFVSEISNYGLIASKEVAGEHCFDEEARHLAQVAHDFSNYGIEPRHLKSLLHAANREAELFSQVVVPLLRQRNPEAREKAQADLAALVSLGAAFKSTLIQAELRNLTGG